MREFKFRAFEDRKMRHFSLRTVMEGFGDDCPYHPIEESIPGTIGIEVMQYTGLKDKNGKEIYEGDIVVQQEHQGTFGVEWIGNGWNILLNSQIYEVIGNIYENPGLLK